LALFILFCLHPDHGDISQAFKMNHTARKYWASLATIERVGLFEYPGLASLAYIPPTLVDQRITLAFRAQQSLLLRLLVRYPLRSRYLSALRIDNELRQDDLQWLIELHEQDLSVNPERQQPRNYSLPFPNDLIPQFEEFLHVWRPMLPGCDRPELFTTRTGRVFAATALNNEVRNIIYQRTGRATDIHAIRRIWLNELLARVQRSVLGERSDQAVEALLYHFIHQSNAR
jgi:hypothetical protein